MDYRKFNEYKEQDYKLIHPDYLKELLAWREIGEASLVALVIFIILFFSNFVF